MSYIIRVIENIIILYFALYFLFDIFLFFFSLFVHKKKRRLKKIDYNGHSISIIVPAFNEEVSVVDCVEMLSLVEYQEFEIIVVNDGSEDNTLEKLREAFSFEPRPVLAHQAIQTNRILSVESNRERHLILIDKENGGKADSINAALNYASKRYICTIDADSILDSLALKKVVIPMIEDERNFVTGGFLATSNDVVMKGRKVESYRMPKNLWVLWQIVEYIKSFMISRLALSRMNMLLIMSGAFSLFRKADLLKVGGFLSEYNESTYIKETIGKNRKTVCEDMEIIVRLWRYYLEKKEKGKATFLPDPICWTEVPEKAENIIKQRARWHQGLGETLHLHRALMFEPRYKIIGLIAIPYYYFFEFLAPLIKLFSLLFLTILSSLGYFNAQWMLLLLISGLLITTIILSVVTVMLEIQHKKNLTGNQQTLRYKTIFDWLWLLIVSILGSFTYEFIKLFAQLKGMLNIWQHKDEWNKFERRGINTKLKQTK